MENFGIEFIKAEDSKFLTLKTTEKIGQNYFLRYLLTQLENRNIFKEDYSHFYFTFCEKRLIYEIILIKSISKNFIYEPFIFEAFYKDDDFQNVDLFITKDFFTLYKDKKLFSCKLIENTKVEDITLFISQSYDLKISNIYYINEDELKNIKTKYILQKNIKNPFNPLKKNNNFKYFIVFNVFIFLTFSFAVFFEYGILTSKKKNPSAEKQIFEYKNKPFFDIVNLFNNIKKSNLLLKDFSFKSGKILITLEDKYQENLIKFTKSFKPKNIKIISIEFTKDIYLLKAEIKND